MISHRQTLALWLSYWAEEQRLAEAGDLPDQLPADVQAPEPNQAERFDSPDLREGEVRVLDPWLVPEAREPVYVALLQAWMDGLMLIAPFSRFPVPATEGEWDTGRDYDQLAVLCVWNAITVPVEVLRRSWFVDCLDSQELEAARAVFRSVATGVALTPELGERVGPPLFHAADPRHDYLAADAEMMRPLAELAARNEEPIKPKSATNVSDLTAPSKMGKTEILPMAASSGVAVVQIVRVPGLGLRVTFRQSRDGRIVVVRVSDSNTKVLSMRLDGGSIVRRGEVVGKIIRGSAKLAATALVDEFGLRDRHGRPLRIETEYGAKEI